MSSEVRVSLKFDDDPSIGRYFHVQVLSKKRKGLLTGTMVKPETPKIELCIALAASIVAQEQNEKYKDNHNPDYCAKIALELYNDVLRKINNATPTATASSNG